MAKRDFPGIFGGAIGRFLNGDGWWILWTVKGTNLCHATEGPFRTKAEARTRAVARRRQRGYKSTYKLNRGGKNTRVNRRDR